MYKKQDTSGWWTVQLVHDARHICTQRRMVLSNNLIVSLESFIIPFQFSILPFYSTDSVQPTLELMLLCASFAGLANQKCILELFAIICINLYSLATHSWYQFDSYFVYYFMMQLHILVVWAKETSQPITPTFSPLPNFTNGMYMAIAKLYNNISINNNIIILATSPSYQLHMCIACKVVWAELWSHCLSVV